MKKLMMLAGAVVTMATTAFGATTVDFATDAMSVAGGSSGTVNGRTLTARLTRDDYKNIGSNDSLNRKGEGWYVGATISWPKVTKKDYHATTVNKVVHVKDGVTYTGVEGFKESGLTVDGKYFIALLANDVAHSTAWELFTAEDLYAAHGADIVRELKLSGGIGGTINVEVPVTTFQIRVPTAGLTELKDGDGVVRFPAVAVKDDGEKVWGEINMAFNQFDAGTLKLEVDVTSTADLNLSATFDLNDHGLRVADGKVVFKSRSCVEAANADQIVTDGGSVSAEVGSTFTFKPDEAWLAEGCVAKEDDGIWTVVYDHVHQWEISADGNMVTASCTNTEGICEYDHEVAMALKAESVDFDWNPHGATLTGTPAATFTKATGLEVGEIWYCDAEGNILAEAPKYTGQYVAKVDVGEMTLEKEFDITKPSGGYKSGWELAEQGVDEKWWVCYESVSNAALHASNGDTVYYRGQETEEIHLDRETDFSSDADITVDLGGKTLTRDVNAEMHICNWLGGKVTLVNGTLKQPTNGVLVEDIFFCGKGDSGGIALGDRIKVLNVALFSDFLNLYADNLELDIVGGEYDIAGLDTDNNGKIVITGGKFGVRKDHAIGKTELELFVDEAYHVVELETGDYKYGVVLKTLTLKIPEATTGYTYVVSNGVAELTGNWVSHTNVYEVFEDDLIEVYFTLKTRCRWTKEPETNPMVIGQITDDTVVDADDLPTAEYIPLTPGDVAGPYDSELEIFFAILTGEVSFAPTDKVREVLDGSKILTEDDYKEMFTHVTYDVDGKYFVTYRLTEDGTNDLIQSANTMATNINIAAIAALPSGETASLNLENGVPGFYYSLLDGAAITDIAPDANEDNLNVLCNKDGQVTFPEVAKPSDGTGFFMIGVRETKTVIPDKDAQ